MDYNSQETEKFLAEVAGAMDDLLKRTFGKEIGFALLVFEFGAPGVGNYVSNGIRADIVKLLRETADRIEKNEVIPPSIGGAQ